jgi:cation diffusion facilitator CzcD-associated flavoprotein CzcO
MNDDTQQGTHRDCFAVIVGSGFAGIAMAHALSQMGIDDYAVLEKASSVGGTWRDNHYPGCACDIPSHIYSLSFEPNARWSESYAPQREIREYIERLVDRHDLRRHILLECEAVSARWDAARSRWDVRARDRRTFSARMLVGAVGPLSRWSFPAIDGLDRFEGAKFHSAAWDHSFDPRGKRIASVGTGASAIQFIPELAKSAAQLTVYQRTAPWVLPRHERKFTEAEKSLLERLPSLARARRDATFWQQEARALLFVRNEFMRRQIEKVAIKHIQSAIGDPALVDKLTPRFSVGCKRILMSNTYYPALAQKNVEVVTTGIRSVTRDSVIGNDGVERRVDAIVFGTGFDVHDYLGPLSVTGPDARDLGALWAAESAQAYMGTMVAGFPNLFFLVGPNTGLGHNSILYMIESQIVVVTRCAALLRERETRAVSVREGAQRAYNDELQRKLSDTVWATGCASWYLDARGRNSTLWPGFAYEFRKTCESFSLSSCDVRDGARA